MLVLIKEYIGLPVLSLRTGGVVASILEPIINPDNLRIEAWYVADHFDRATLVLVRDEIRDVLPKGIVIDDHEALVDPEELIRLKSIMNIRFDPIGKDVITTHKHKLGRVYDYAVDEKTYYIKKLYTAQRFIKSVMGTDKSIDRTQIVEITDRSIIVRDTTIPAFAPAEQPAPA